MTTQSFFHIILGRPSAKSVRKSLWVALAPGVGLLLAGGLASCAKDGPQAERSFDVAPYNRVVATVEADIELRVGSQGPVRVSAPENYIDALNIWVSDSTLHIEKRGNLNFGSKSKRITLTVPAYQAVTATGSGNVSATAVLPVTSGTFTFEHTGSGNSDLATMARHLNAKSTGSGNTNLRLAGAAGAINVEHTGSGEMEVGGGTADTLVLRQTGSGNFSSDGMAVQGARVAQTGSGNVTVQVLRTLVGSLTGSGNLEYYGNPGRVEVDVEGSGDLIKR